jgi:ankyrin repeat protein
MVCRENHSSPHSRETFSTPLFLRDVGKYYWNRTRIRADFQTFNLERWAVLNSYIRAFPYLEQDNLLSIASFYGDLRLVKILLKTNSFPSLEDFLLSACFGNRIHIVKFFLENGAEQPYDSAFEACIYYGHLEILKLLKNPADNTSYYGLYHGCINGEFQTVKHAMENGVVCNYGNTFLLLATCEKGHFDIVRFLVQNNTEITWECVRHAYRNAHYRIAIFLFWHYLKNKIF